MKVVIEEIEWVWMNADQRNALLPYEIAIRRERTGVGDREFEGPADEILKALSR